MNIKELKKLAKAALVYTPEINDPGELVDYLGIRLEEAKFVVAANPKIILELVDRLIAAEEKLKKLKALQPETLNTSEIVLVELKTKVGRLSGPQKRLIAKLRDQGVSVYVIDSVEGFEEVLERHGN